MGFMKKLTSVIVASSLVLGLVGTGFAAFDTTGVNAAANRMKDLGLVQGKVAGSADLQLGSNITRAELVTIIARAYGQEANAAFLKGAVSFPDVAASHWATGYIAISKNIIEAQGHTMGMPNGTFQPDANVTSAEAVAFMLKFLGVPFNMSTTSWPDGYIQVAVDRGLINADDKAMLTTAANQAATRGLVFYLADNSFYNYKLANGKTVYTTYVDATAPTLSIDSVGASTTAAKATISGSVSADATAVYVGSMANSVTVTAGKFSTEVDLTMGTNAIAVMAVDLAGNVSEKSVSITRTVGAAAEIKAPASITVKAGAQAEAKAEVVDKDGNVIAGEVVTGESTLGTFEAGVFTAGTAAGTGTLTLTHGPHTYSVDVTVEAGALAKVNASATSVAPGAIVTLKGTDAHGNELTGVSFSVDSADALVGSNGNFIGSKAGSYVVTATKDGASATVTIGVSGSASKVVLETASTIIANNSSTIDVTAKVVDANGNIVTGWDQAVALTFSPTGTLVDGGVGGLSIVPTNGVAQFKLKTAGAPAGQVIEITSTTTKNAVNYTGKTTVQAVAQVATGVKFSTSPEYLSANGVNNSLFKVRVVDQAGKAMLTGTGAWQIDLALTGPATFLSNAKTTATAFYTAGTDATESLTSQTGLTGAVNVTATVGGVGTATLTTNAVIATDPASLKVTVDSTTTNTGYANDVDALKVHVQVVDKNGVPVNAPGTASLKVYTDVDSSATKLGYLTIADSAAVDVKGQANPITLTNGAGSITVKSTSLTGSLAVTIKDTGASALGQGVASLSFNAHTATQVAWEKTTLRVSSSNTEVTINGQLKDASGNKVVKAGVEVTATATNGTGYKATVNGAQSTAKVSTDANGVASFTVSMPGYTGETYSFTLTSTGLTSPAPAVVTVTNVVAASVGVTIHDSGSGAQIFSQSADNPVVLKVTVKDAFGNPIDYTGGTISDMIKIDSLTNTTLAAQPTWTYAAGVYTSSAFSLKKAGSFTVQMNDVTAPTTVSGSAVVTVTPGVVAKAIITQANSSNVVSLTNGAVSGPFTVQLADQYGNAQVAATSTTVTLTVGGTPGAGNYFILRSSADGADITNRTIPVGGNSATFYILANTTTGMNLTMSLGGEVYTFSF